MHHQPSQEYWDRQSPLITKIFEHGAEKFFQSVPDIEQAFHPGDRWLRCIDEGCPGGVHLAGSGVLLGEDMAAKIAQAAGVTAVTSHEECGAAKLAAQQAGVDVAQSDAHGKEFAARLAKRLGVSYTHLPLSEMARPAHLHVARVVYYDGTGKFDPARVPELPPGFVISRRFLTKTYAVKECEIAVSIALGDHGFGKLFTPDEPLLIIVIGHPTDAALGLEQLGTEVTPLAAAHGQRVVVDGLTATVATN